MLDVDLVIRAPRALIDGEERAASVAVDDGVVVGIGSLEQAWQTDAERVLTDDVVLIPGVVDTHVHVNEPGRTEWEGFASATAAAAAGGVTTLIDMPLNSIPPTTTVEALELKRSVAASKARVDVGFWGGAIPSSLGHLRELHEAGVFGFKCFLAPSGVDEYPHLEPAQVLEAMEEIASFGGLLIVHAEDPGHLDDAAAPGTDAVAFASTRPDAAETTAIQSVIDGVRSTGCRAHILHLSSAAALPAIREAKAEGLPLTVETCPHYLTFDAAHIPDGGTQYKCCPPIRDEANREALWEALADGTIDFIASDHSPATADLKLAGQGDFAQAWGGIAGLEVSLSAIWTGASSRGYSLADVLGWMSAKTAAWAGLAAKGGIALGKDADLVAFAPDDERVIHAGELHHKNPVTAFDGHALRGVARTTWLRGSVVNGEGSVPGVTGALIARPA
ncbi:allantoinase AllB [Demequina sp. NBRC 110054]|uniref:allantoinase AllB n=1 Tax=Demequina sp. NBRC 110054 TaxID=1570343 RepID=UPI000A0654AA|nr:allantoinase AllB [Demequina sp. NBRC 110054]